MKKKRTPAKKKVVAVKPIRRVVVRAVNKSQGSHKKTILRLGFSMKSLHFGMHAIIAISAVGVLFALGAIDHDRFAARFSNAAPANTATIGLTYTQPLSVNILAARKDASSGFFSITNGSTETITVNVPSAWQRLEVSGAKLEDVTAGVPTFGFIAWTLPGKASIKLSGEMPDAFFFNTDSEAVAAISLKWVDMTGDTVTADTGVVLLKKQNLVKLWEVR